MGLLQDSGEGPWHQGDAVSIQMPDRLGKHEIHSTVTLVGPRHLIEAVAQFLTDKQPHEYEFYKATVGRHDD